MLGNKTATVYNVLRTEFLDGAWQFGQTFSTYELAARLGVSRRPIIDAMHRLQSDGFVEITPQVGCQVVMPEEARMRDNLELSAALEPPAARLAALRATPAGIEHLTEIHARATEAIERLDADAYPTLNREFHMAILRMSENEAVASMAAAAWDLRQFYFNPYRTLAAPSELPKRHDDHGRLLEAIREGDGDRAQAVMTRHLDPGYGLGLIRRYRAATVRNLT
jgi:DNA-binding GntR family transcriptional regulator